LRNRTHCFWWELHLQNKMKSGQPCTRGLKFMYSGQILFLLPKTQVHTTFLNMHQWEAAIRNNTVMKTNRANEIQIVAHTHNTYITCRHHESAKIILAKGKSWATVVGNSEGEKWTYWWGQNFHFVACTSIQKTEWWPKYWAKMAMVGVMWTAKIQHFTYNMHSAILHQLPLLMSHLLMRTIFNNKTCQQFCKFQITSLSDALFTESLELPNVS
jgi:hypothetical protein